MVVRSIVGQLDKIALEVIHFRSKDKNIPTDQVRFKVFLAKNQITRFLCQKINNMIQRIQTLFLLLVAIAMITAVATPIWLQVNAMGNQYVEMTAWQITISELPQKNTLSQSSNIYIGILALLAAVIAIYSLLQFKNRKKQLMLNMINALLMGLTLGLVVYTSFKTNEDFNPAVSGSFVLGFYAIAFALIMNLVANRFIRKDEMLIRSVDRIR